MPMITMKHFEAAMRESRRSVNDAKLAEYDNFNREQNMQKQKLSATTGQSLAGFTFPGQEGRGGGGAAAPAAAGAAAGDEVRSFSTVWKLCFCHPAHILTLFYVFYPLTPTAGLVQLSAWFPLCR